MPKLNKTLRLVQAMGGYEECAKILGYKVPAIYDWVKKDKIPCESGYLLFLDVQRKAQQSTKPRYHKFAPTLEDFFHHLAPRSPQIEAAINESMFFKGGK